MHTEGETFYFTKACENLTKEDINEIYRNFLKPLEKEGVCQNNGSKTCYMKVGSILLT